MQYILDMLLGEVLFTAVCHAKHAYYLLGVGDKVWQLFRWKHVVLIEIENVATKKL